MNKPAVIGILWAASLALAWFLGTNSGDESSQRQDRATTNTNGPTEPRRAPAETGSKEAETRSAAEPEAEETKEPPPPDKPFTTKGAQNVGELSKRFMNYFEQSMRKGTEGHLELYRTFDQLTQDRSLRDFFRDESQLTKLIYPWLKFAMKNDRHLIAMTETIYKTAAENPSWFEGTDDDTLEIFVEGLGTILPGAVDEETMARFRGYVEKILLHSKDTLPKAMQKRMRDFARNLEHWTAPLTTDESLAKLNDPSVATAVKLRILRSIDKKFLVGVDVVSILRPAIEAGQSNALNVLGRVGLSSGDVAVLDQVFVEAIAKGEYSSWHLRTWVSSTGRSKWEEVRPFMETGLGRGGKATEQFAMALAYFRPQPPKEFVQRVLNSYALSDGVVKTLKQRFKIE